MGSLFSRNADREYATFIGQNLFRPVLCAGCAEWQLEMVPCWVRSVKHDGDLSYKRRRILSVGGQVDTGYIQTVPCRLSASGGYRAHVSDTVPDECSGAAESLLLQKCDNVPEVRLAESGTPS